MPLLRRRPPVPFAQWGHEIREFRSVQYGTIRFAQWNHPLISEQVITEAEVVGLRRFIRPGDFAIDVGAHTGDTTLPMAIAAGPTGRVLALEPNPHVFEVLEVNARLNPHVARIDPRCIAATDADGDILFHYGDASFGNGGLLTRRVNPFRRRFPLQVVGRNLLRLLREQYAESLARLSYVKVDAEGHDLAVLKSIQPVLSDYHPVIRTEVFRKLGRPERYALHDFLTSTGYDVFRFEEGADPQGASIRREQMTGEKHFDVLALPRT